jgi:phage gpG-like protein
VVDFAEAVVNLKALQTQVAKSAAPVASAMGSTLQDRVQRTLKSGVHHGPGMFYKATPGIAPAYASGNLARSIIMVPAADSIRATALVGATATYSALQEWGGSTWPNRGKYLHWTNDAGPWWKKRVFIPEHPYFRPSVESSVRDGSLTRSAMSKYSQQIAPFLRG